MNTKLTNTMLATAALAGTAMGGQTDGELLNWYAAELLADTQQRSSFLGVHEYAPTVFGFLQTRYNLSHSSGSLGGEDLTNGFEIPRARLGIKGLVHSRVGYYIQTDFASSGGSGTLLDAYGWIKLGEGSKLTVGQFKSPFSRETLMPSSRQLMVNSSTTESFFSHGYMQGLKMSLNNERWRFNGAFSDGMKSQNTVYSGAGEADWALTGRAEFLHKGSWGQFKDFTSWRNSDKGVMFGAALHWQDGGGTNGTVDDTYFALTGDASFEFSGWNLFAAGHWRKSELAAGTDYTDMGLVFHGGYFLTDVVELTGRYDAVLADSDRPTPDDYHTVAIGLNYYMIPESHAAKLTVEAQFFLDGDTTSPVTPSGKLGSVSSTDDQFGLRAQLQIAF